MNITLKSKKAYIRNDYLNIDLFFDVNIFNKRNDLSVQVLFIFKRKHILRRHNLFFNLLT